MTTRSLQRLALMATVVTTLVGALGACAPLVVGGVATGVMVANDRRTSGIQLEDEGIELRTANRLRDALGDRGHVNITSFNRQVLLTGEVPTEADKANIERAVGQVENVRLVLNEVAVMGNTSFSQRSNDTLVTGRVKAAVVDARDLTVHAFKFVTERGTVYIMGRVTQREANRVTDVVRSVQGVARVVRALDVISEEELARMQPKPAPKKDTASADN
ncbi:MAG: BON domain-containing protein [Burkholderiales bacterium]|nr:BON domain-containing protein [Burkholderiales bacterium]